jgi:hypothetical protein
LIRPRTACDSISWAATGVTALNITGPNRLWTWRVRLLFDWVRQIARVWSEHEYTAAFAISRSYYSCGTCMVTWIVNVGEPAHCEQVRGMSRAAHFGSAT